MELETAIRSRHMVRSFLDRPVDPQVLDQILEMARRAPSAGHTAATEFVVLTGTDRRRYWDLTLPAPRQSTFTFPKLLLAGALVLVLARPDSYTERYTEPDKSGTGLGGSTDDWPVPFWWVDAGAVIQNLLLLAPCEALGACLFGVFEHEAAVKHEFAIPADRRIVAAIAIGHPTDGQSRPGRSAERQRPELRSIIHRGQWTPGS